MRLKSNMDRFIVINHTVNDVVDFCLKSNMDRFIGDKADCEFVERTV